MKPATLFLVSVVFLGATTAHALWSVSDKGTWPESWPKELEPLRGQSESWTGPAFNRTFHQIRFTSREEFEAAWPHLLKVKTDGAPIILVRAGRGRYYLPLKNGVRVWTALPTAKPVPAKSIPAKPIAGDRHPRSTWIYTTFIELAVDGEIVDLNRISLPPDTPIIDERFVDEKGDKAK